MQDLGRGAGERELPRAEPTGQGWSMAAAGASESSVAPAGSPEASSEPGVGT